MTIQGFGFGNEDASSLGALVLIVRCPEDLRREHVKFSLKGLDLL
jgi:hypothetical protein